MSVVSVVSAMSLVSLVSLVSVVSEPVDTGLIDLIIIVIAGVLITDAVWRWMLRRRR